MCFAPQRHALFRHLQLSKVSDVLYILTSKCASRHNGVHFFDISTSKVVRQWCALYILTWKCASRHNACTFSTSQLPKVVRQWCVLYILTWKCASRHNGVHFFDISTSKSGPTMVCFVHFDLECASRHNGVQFFIAALASLLFDPREPQIIGKTQCFATFLPFHASASSFLLTLLSSNLSLLSASSLLCFSSVHIVGSLTSKLPSITTTILRAA